MKSPKKISNTKIPIIVIKQMLPIFFGLFFNLLIYSFIKNGNMNPWKFIINKHDTPIILPTFGYRKTVNTAE